MDVEPPHAAPHRSGSVGPPEEVSRGEVGDLLANDRREGKCECEAENVQLSEES